MKRKSDFIGFDHSVWQEIFPLWSLLLNFEWIKMMYKENSKGRICCTLWKMYWGQIILWGFYLTRSRGASLVSSCIKSSTISKSRSGIYWEFLALIISVVWSVILNLLCLLVSVCSCLFKIVKFLVFPSELKESPPLCGVKGNCSVPTQPPFLSKNPVNQTENITAGKNIYVIHNNDNHTHLLYVWVVWGF